MKYKVYTVKKNKLNNQDMFFEAEFNIESGFNSVDEANEFIQDYGLNNVRYTILPYIFMTNKD